MAVKSKVRRIQATLRSGKRLRIPAWELETGRAGPCLLLIAAQHGNEVQGSEAIRRFVDLAKERLAKGRVIAVPFANLAALRDRRPHIHMKPEQPYGDDRGHNMNRTWPGRRSGNDTARVSYAIYRAFGDEATHLFDLHCWEKNTAPGIIIRDNPALREIAGRLGHRFVHVRPPANTPLSGYFNATGRLGITFEFSGQYLVHEDQVRHGLMLIANFAKEIGLLRGRLRKGHDPILFSDACEIVTVTAPCSGLYVASGDLKLCDPVSKGTKLGHILSDKNLRTQVIPSPVTGYLSVHGGKRPNCDVSLADQHPYVTRGETLATIWKVAKKRG